MTDKPEAAKYVKMEFDFGWKTGIGYPLGELALRHNRGDVIDIGCATCQLWVYLQQHGWKGKYTGVDVNRYEGYAYPPGVDLLIGDVLTMDLPEADTAIVYDVLEHVSDPVGVLRKALSAAPHAIVDVPKRNEEMWKLGIVEFHQLGLGSREHMHCGFTKEELTNIVDAAGGRIENFREHTKIDASIGCRLWKSRFARKAHEFLARHCESREFYQLMWCEVVRKDSPPR